MNELSNENLNTDDSTKKEENPSDLYKSEGSPTPSIVKRSSDDDFKILDKHSKDSERQSNSSLSKPDLADNPISNGPASDHCTKNSPARNSKSENNSNDLKAHAGDYASMFVNTIHSQNDGMDSKAMKGKYIEVFATNKLKKN